MATDAVHDLNSLLSSKERDFLIRNNGDQVKISSIKGKVGLYFSASWCIPCCIFTPRLAHVYNELASSKTDFEVVFVPSDKTEDTFKDYFSKMPWLSVPFSDSNTIKSLKELFNVRAIPHLVVLDSNGKVSTEEGMSLVDEYGVQAYPFTSEHIKLLEDKEEAKKKQTIISLLSSTSTSRDFVVSNDGIQTPISELEGKLVGLYFSKHGHEFTPILIETYKKLKEKEEKFEIVLISLDDEDEDYKEAFKTMPWLALPFQDEKCQKLNQYFEVSDVPTLVIIGQDGKTLNTNAVELIKEHGVEAYPFTPEKPEEPAEDPNTKLENSESAVCPSVCGAEKMEIYLNVSCCSNEAENCELKDEEEKNCELKDEEEKKSKE